MKMYYLIEDKRFLDNYMIRERLNISKSLFQHLTKKYKIEDEEILRVQNKTLYSIHGIVGVLKKAVNESE
jgi:hypothetical protein